MVGVRLEGADAGQLQARCLAVLVPRLPFGSLLMVA